MCVCVCFFWLVLNTVHLGTSVRDPEPLRRLELETPDFTKHGDGPKAPRTTWGFLG